MTSSTITVDAAAQASIGAAAKELHLPTGRAEAGRLAEIAVRKRQTPPQLPNLEPSSTIPNPTRTRALVEVLLAHRTLPADALITAMDRAVTAGRLEPRVVITDARRVAETHVAPVIPIGSLAPYDRPAPSLSE